MAIQGTNLRAIEADWYRTRSGLTPNATVTAHKKAYYSSKGIAESKSLGQMEREWLQSVGSSTSIRPYELWSRACDAQTVAVGKSIDSCKFNFYTSVASGTNP